jgi:catechol-2,3-dioxygenase
LLIRRRKPQWQEASAMAIQLDHIILAVNDLAQSIDFYVGVLGLKHEGARR